ILCRRTARLALPGRVRGLRLAISSAPRIALFARASLAGTLAGGRAFIGLGRALTLGLHFFPFGTPCLQVFLAGAFRFHVFLAGGLQFILMGRALPGRRAFRLGLAAHAIFVRLGSLRGLSFLLGWASCLAARFRAALALDLSAALRFRGGRSRRRARLFSAAPRGAAGGPPPPLFCRPTQPPPPPHRVPPGGFYALVWFSSLCPPC